MSHDDASGNDPDDSPSSPADRQNASPSNQQTPTSGPEPMAMPEHAPGWFGKWAAIPLYWRIVVGMFLGVGLGIALGDSAAVFKIPSNIILQLLSALAPPLILVAVVNVLMTSVIPKGSVGRLAGLLLLNTCVAILIGLGVANLMQPGKFGQLAEQPPSADTPADSPGADNSGALAVTGDELPTDEADTAPIASRSGITQDGSEANEPSVAEIGEREAERTSPIDQLLKSVPRSLLGPLGDQQNVIGIIIIAVAFGIALRSQKERRIDKLTDFVAVTYETLLAVLHWIIELVPLGVMCVVAAVVGTEGFGAFQRLGAFVVAVLIALGLQTLWYLVRIKFFSWVSPIAVLRGMRDALFMAFSTDSSTATMPVTYACLKEKVGVREESASLGGLVGANFNNDGTALYEAMAALFVAQMVGIELGLIEQLTIVMTSILASVGAAGIPEAGIVTMTLVFNAVGLSVEHIPLLLTVDWFLDRCRTTINVLGDVNVSCLLDGRTPPETTEPESARGSTDAGQV